MADYFVYQKSEHLLLLGNERFNDDILVSKPLIVAHFQPHWKTDSEAQSVPKSSRVSVAAQAAAPTASLPAVGAVSLQYTARHKLFMHCIIIDSTGIN